MTKIIFFKGFPMEDFLLPNNHNCKHSIINDVYLKNKVKLKKYGIVKQCRLCYRVFNYEMTKELSIGELE